MPRARPGGELARFVGVTNKRRAIANSVANSVVLDVGLFKEPVLEGVRTVALSGTRIRAVIANQTGVDLRGVRLHEVHHVGAWSGVGTQGAALCFVLTIQLLDVEACWLFSFFLGGKVRYKVLAVIHDESRVETWHACSVF